jgi:DNA-damage-inducible protein J
MSRKEDRIQARIEPNLKQSAEAIFSRLGLTATQAIRMFYAQVEMRGGIPFDVVIPNKETQEAMEEGEDPAALKKYSSFKALRDEVGV